MKGKTWTELEENTVLAAVKASPNNLKQAFETAAEELDRSAGACSNRWYSVISKRTDKKSIALICVSGKTYGVNRKNCKAGLTLNQRRSFRNVWSRLVDFFSV